MKKGTYDIDKQHQKGKLHAIERIELLVDKNSFLETGSEITHSATQFGLDKKPAPYDGVITGFGTIGGRKVAIYSQDFTIIGGTLGKMHGEKIASTIQSAIEMGCPVIGINDSGGARIQEGVHALAGYGSIFYHNTKASGYVPQISIIAGPCAGGAVYSPGLTDFIFVVDEISNMFVTGPAVVKQVLFQDVTAEELGGAKVHATKSGVAHFRTESEVECYHKVRQLLSMVPHCAAHPAEEVTHSYERKAQTRIDKVLPDKANAAYDIKTIINQMADRGSFVEVMEEHAPNMVVGFAKLSHVLVGIVANQPKVMAGVIDCDASDKTARFVRYCDAFNIPLLTLVDVPGYMPGIDQEQKGIIRHGAKILYAYSEATVPKITVIVRKAFGGAYIAMCSKHLGADFVFAWPTAQIAVMGAEGAVNIVYRREIKAAADPQRVRDEKIAQYNEEYLNPHLAAKAGYVDEIIDPVQTRRLVYNALKLLSGKRPTETVPKRHGNGPL
jgi:methylmalonyl-CoA decarboxylase subunit alpha